MEHFNVRAIAACLVIFLICLGFAGEHVFFAKEFIHEATFAGDQSMDGFRPGPGPRGEATQPFIEVELVDGRRVLAIFGSRLNPPLEKTFRVKKVRGGITQRPRFFVVQ